MIIRPILAAAFVALATPALATQCPGMMQEIDAALADAPTLTDEQRAEVEQLRAEGEELHAAGDHAESEAKLNEAKEILGL